jgi:hypothetical protein
MPKVIATTLLATGGSARDPAQASVADLCGRVRADLRGYRRLLANTDLTADRRRELGRWARRYALATNVAMYLEPRAPGS